MSSAVLSVCSCVFVVLVRTFELEWPSPWGQRRPPESLVHDEVHDGSMLLNQPVRELAISPQIGRNAVELVDAVCP